MPFEVLHRHLLVDQKTLFQQRLNHVKGPGQALLPLIDGTTLLCWININGRIHPTFDFLGSRSWSNLVVVKISQFPQGAAEQWWVFSAAYLFALDKLLTRRYLSGAFSKTCRPSSAKQLAVLPEHQPQPLSFWVLIHGLLLGLLCDKTHISLVTPMWLTGSA